MSPICFGVNDILSQAMIKKNLDEDINEWRLILSLGDIMYVQFKYLVLCTSGFF